MRNILLTVAYDGTNYYGWQRQPHTHTVEKVLKNAIAAIHTQPKDICAAGRTDTGVHAEGQRVNFHSDRDSIPADQFRHAINANLPCDVRIYESRLVPSKFHARFDARFRTYRYLLTNTEKTNPCWRNYCWHIRKPLPLPTLNRMAAALVGTHDFTAFSKHHGSTGAPKNAVRNVRHALFFPSNRFLIFEITANSFLRNMVRSIIGTIIEIIGKRNSAERFAEILYSKKKENAGTTAPPQGLVLYKIWYDSLNTLPCRN